MARSRNNAIRVEGLKQLQSDIRRTQDAELKKQLRTANKQAAQIVADEAQNLVPRRSGKLAATIKAKGGQRDAVVRAGTGSRVPYAGPIHFGWTARNIRPQPFMYEAQDKRRGEVIRFYEKAMEDLAKKF